VRPRAWIASVPLLCSVAARAADSASDVPPAAEASGEGTELPATETGSAQRPEEAPSARPKAAAASVTVTEDLELRYWMLDARVPGFPDRRVLDYVEQVNRLTASVNAGRLSAHAQVDQVALMANEYALDDVVVRERDLISGDLRSPWPDGTFYANVEKFGLRYASPAVELQLGDSYAAFGRGLALNLNRNVDLDVDTSIQGVKALIRAGNWDITGLAGQLNRQQVFQDNPNLGIHGDRRHGILGLRADGFGFGPVNLGAHAVAYAFTGDTGWKAGFERVTTPVDVVAVGGNVEAVGVGGLDLYLEGNGFAFPTDATFGGAPAEPGFAVYGSATAYPGPFVLTVDGKAYKNAARVNTLLTPELYNAAIGPTLEYERATTEDSAAATNSNEIYGGRAQLDWSAAPGLSPFVSVAVFRDVALGPLSFHQVPETIVHGLVGLEAIGDSASLIAHTGVRVDDRDGEEFGYDLQVHGDLLGRAPLGKGWFLDGAFALEHFKWGRNSISQHDYVEMETAVSVQSGSLVTLTWYTDFTTNPLVTTTGNLSDAVYGAGEIQVKPVGNITIKGFFGAYKAGIRCSGGQCRRLPGFEGGRISVTAAF
jgi:hypothetical protein